MFLFPDAACMATVMGFRELYEHLGGIEPDPEPRWRLVYRIKRSLGAEELGGYGKDQCYLAGAVKILLNRRKLNFPMLFSGKLSYDEVDKIRRTVRLEGCLRSPYLELVFSYLLQVFAPLKREKKQKEEDFLIVTYAISFEI